MTRFPGLGLAVPATELTWRHDFMRGLDHLPVRDAGPDGPIPGAPAMAAGLELNRRNSLKPDRRLKAPLFSPTWRNG